MNAWLDDLRFACRMLLKSPGFTVIAVITLALGIGANTVLFSIINGVLLRPLAYPQPERIVAMDESNAGQSRAPISYLNFLDWQRSAQTFASMAIYHHENHELTGGGPAELLNGFMISADYFRTLGVRPILGRDFNRGDDHLGAAPVAIVSNAFWHRHFGGAPDALGKPLNLDGAQYTIVGVLPPDFSFYGVVRDVYTPIGQWSDPSFRDRRVDMSAHAVGRLKPGVTLAQARQDMNALARRLAVEYPEADRDVGITLVPLKEDIVGNVQPILVVLLAAVGFLLLIACVNVASLQLARAIRRSGEFAIRAALGVSRWRVARQLLTESLLLAGLGGAAGLAMAFFGGKAVMALLPADFPRAQEIALDGRVLLFTLAVSLAGGILFGMTPALRSSRGNLQQVLRQSARGSGGARHRTQGMFVAVEVATALVLLVGAGLMLRTLAALWHQNPGYDPNHAITFSVTFPANAKTSAEETRARLRRFDAAIRAIPGVQAVSVTLGSRPMIHDSELPFWIEGEPKPANDNDMHQALFYLVESGFRPAMGMNLERGRFITDQDNEHAPVVVDIDDALARRYFPHKNPVGQHIHIAEFDTEAEIVGVVGHVRQWGPGNDAQTAIEAQFYYPMMQVPAKLMPLIASGVAVVLRTQDDPHDVMPAVRKAAADLDPGEIVYAVETMHGVLEQTLAARRLAMILLSVFASLALALTCVGIYGVISWVVSERTREIGVRMALGAQRHDVLRLVLTQGAAMALFGMALGIATALPLTRLLRSLLFGVVAHDPLTFAGVAALLLAVAMAACWVPARRAMSVDPIAALRHE